MTLPLAWRQRRLQVPAGLMLHFADLGSPDRAFHGEVPITTPRRTIQDCIAAEVAPELVRQALFQSRRRGILSPQNAKPLEQELAALRQKFEVCRSLLRDLIERGLKVERLRQIVLDGGMGLRKAVDQVFGRFAVVQRCQVHKLRNVLGHPPKDRRCVSRRTWCALVRRINPSEASKEVKVAQSQPTVDSSPEIGTPSGVPRGEPQWQATCRASQFVGTSNRRFGCWDMSAYRRRGKEFGLRHLTY